MQTRVQGKSSSHLLVVPHPHKNAGATGKGTRVYSKEGEAPASVDGVCGALAWKLSCVVKSSLPSISGSPLSRHIVGPHVLVPVWVPQLLL